MGISQYQLAKEIGVQAMRINEIVHGKRAVTADTALRLSIYFGNSPRFWMSLQSDYDLAVKEDADGDRLKSEIRTIAAILHETAKRLFSLSTRKVESESGRL